MDQKQRHKKLRLLIRKLNKERKKQAKKLDILCNDFVTAQRNFIKKLNTVSFTANFYEAIVGASDLNDLVLIAGKLIKEKIPRTNVAFFLHRQDNLELHMFESDQPISLQKQHLENCFTPELVDNICKSNKICTLDDMFAMGLQGNLNKISAVTVPLGLPGRSLGFILIYRSSEKKFTPDELNSIAAVTSGLSSAIASCKVLSHSID